MQQIISALVVFGVLIAAGIYMYRWQLRKADSLLEEWAERSQLRILAKERANPPGTGPDAMRAANKQVMYRVTLVDAEGVERRGLVKLGTESTGVLSERVEVLWDER